MKIGLSNMSLLPFPLLDAMKKASKAGFDFIEVCLLGAPILGRFAFGRWSDSAVAGSIEMAGKLKLSVHFHQPFTTEESAKSEEHMLKMMTTFGVIPKEGYRLTDWIPRSARPLVAYAERIGQFNIEGGVWYQSIAMENPDHKGLRLSRKEFLRKVGEQNLPVVYDTEHDREFENGQHGVHLVNPDKAAALDHYTFSIQRLGTQIKEVHFNDFDPALGPSRGRNLWPGTGVVPLKEIAELLKKSACQYAVPEIPPKLPMPWSSKELLALRKTMDNYFG